MFWRVPRRRDYEAIRGPRARTAFRRLVGARKVRGLLAFEDGEAVGWCSYGPRREFPLTETKRAYAVHDAERVWAVNCFYIRRDRRGQGMAGRLLQTAVEAARRAGAAVLEGYPRSADRRAFHPAAFYPGTPSMFRAAGFRVAQELVSGQPLMRRRLARRPHR